MGKTLAAVLNDQINRLVRRDFDHEQVVRSVSIAAFAHVEHIRSVLAGAATPDNVTLVALSRALEIPEAQLYSALQKDLAAQDGREVYFDIPRDDDDATSDAV